MVTRTDSWKLSEELRLIASRNHSGKSCEWCRKDKKRCEDGVDHTCLRCIKKQRVCTRGLNPDVIAFFGPTGSFVEFKEGQHFVIYDGTDGIKYVAHLDRNNQLVGDVKSIGRMEFALHVASALLTYTKDFTVDELLAPGLADACEKRIHQARPPPKAAQK